MSGPTPPRWSPTVAATPTERNLGTRRAIWVGGVVLVLVGTFLPWLRSGRIQRNSYELAGVGVRRLRVPEWTEVFLRGWPFLGVLWGVAVALLILGRVEPARVLSTLLGVITGLVAAGGLFLAVRLDSFLLGGTVVGPLVTALGAAAVLLMNSRMTRRRHIHPQSMQRTTLLPPSDEGN